MSEESMKLAPPPWKCRATIYQLAFRPNKAQIDTANAAGLTYSPLEADSPFADTKHVGRLGLIQIIRYSDTPVGPYDELILAPGFHEYYVEEGGKPVKKSNVRITRIYVSQKHTCWNGRKNWNIPKHLASFDFNEHADGTLEIQVFANDTTGDVTEATADRTPIFRAKFKPISYAPSFPLSTKLVAYLGLDLTLVQPPLPEGQGSQGELVGTDKWCGVLPYIYTSRASLGWIDLQKTDERGNSTYGEHNLWPGLGRWHMGVKLEDSLIEFDAGRHWDAPKPKPDL